MLSKLGGGGGGATGLLNKGGGSNRLPGLVTKQQAVEFPQVLTSNTYFAKLKPLYTGLFPSVHILRNPRNVGTPIIHWTLWPGPKSVHISRFHCSIGGAIAAIVRASKSRFVIYIYVCVFAEFHLGGGGGERGQLPPPPSDILCPPLGLKY